MTRRDDVTQLLFVYGTLRAAGGPPEAIAATLAVGVTHLGAAWTRGTMADLHGFQALQTKGSDRIEGELLRIQDAATWTALDAYEGVGEAGWYERRLVVAVDAAGQPRSAWAYVAPEP